MKTEKRTMCEKHLGDAEYWITSIQHFLIYTFAMLHTIPYTTCLFHFIPFFGRLASLTNIYTFLGVKEFLISKQKCCYLNMLNNRWPFYLSIDLFTRFFNFPIFESILIDSFYHRLPLHFGLCTKNPPKKNEHHFKWHVSASIDKKQCIYECQIDWHRCEVDRHWILFFILLLVVFILFFQRIHKMKICVCETKTFTR